MIDGRVGSRLKLLAVLVAFMFAALTVRLWYLQVLASDQFSREANSNGIRFVQTPAERGKILDDRGNEFVRNRATIEVSVNRQQLGGDENAVLRRLSGPKMLDTPVPKLKAKLESEAFYPYQPVPIAVDVPVRVANAIGEHQDMFPGVTSRDTAVRTYPQGDLAAQILGHIGPISPEDLKDNPYFASYDINDQVGKDGLEREYDHYLQGTKGVQKYRVNASNENLGSIGDAQSPVPGDNVVLNIDARIQQAAEEALAGGIEGAQGELDTATNQYLHANAGAVVVMDPNTGAIKAIASNPTFDPSLFVGGIAAKPYKRLNSKQAGDPLFDRAIAGQYPPGSTFKPFVALSAVHDGIASLNGSYACPPDYTVPGDTSGTVFHNWTTVNLGYFSLADALKYSCDTVFYPWGYDYWRQYYPTRNSSKPSEPLQRDLGQFGFGRDTGVDLPTGVEKPGFIPTAAWKNRMSKEDPKVFGAFGWVPGDLIQMTIGQGNVLATPLQMATAYSVIANGGKVCAPHLAARIETPAGRTLKRIDPKCEPTPYYTASQLGYIRDALETVTTGGTAAPAFVGFPLSQYPIAGKTGTAQVGGDRQDSSWFASMAPANNPKYVVVAIVEQGGHGSTTAAPIVRNVYEHLFNIPTTRFHTGGAND